MFIAEILTAFLLDRMIGHPENQYHPVRGIGWLISYSENKLRLVRAGERSNYVRGGLMVLFVAVIVSVASIILLRLTDLLVSAERIITVPPIGMIDLHESIVFIFSTVIIYFSFSLRDLGGLARDCEQLVDRGKLQEARLKLKGLVGRDTSELTGAEIKKAAIESVAENLNDSFISPIFYAALFGPVGAILYRTINTIDSMCGYKNKKYLEFGFVGAKFDDFLNYIPARICGLVLILAGALRRRGLATVRALGRASAQANISHASPNAWVPEVAFAEILSIRLGGSAAYGGKLVFRPEMGPAAAEIEELDVSMAVGLLWSAAYIYLTMHLLLALAVIL